MRFRTTRWNTIRDFGAEDEMVRNRAFDEIVTIYGPPLLAFARRKFRTLADHEGLVQNFFLRQFKTRGLANAREQKGRFRDFLLAAFERQGLNEVRDEGAQIRKPPAGIIPLGMLVDNLGPAMQPRGRETPEDVYERVFRRTTLLKALNDLKVQCADRKERFAIFYAREIEPELSGTDTPTYDQLAARFGLSVDSVRRIVTSARRQLRDLLLASIKSDGVSSAEAQSELSLVLPSAAAEADGVGSGSARK